MSERDNHTIYEFTPPLLSEFERGRSEGQREGREALASLARATPPSSGLSLSLRDDPLAISELLADGVRERERLHALLLDIMRAIPDGAAIPQADWPEAIQEMKAQCDALTAERDALVAAWDALTARADTAERDRDYWKLRARGVSHDDASARLLRPTP